MSDAYLGQPSAKLKKWCEDHYGKKDLGPLCFTAQESGTTVAMIAYDDMYGEQVETFMDLETTSTPEDESSWTKYLGQVIYLDQCPGNKVYFRAGDAGNPYGIWDQLLSKHQYFTISDGKVAASGNIMYLLTKDGKRTSMVVDESTSSSFYQLFSGCTSLTQAPELPAMTLADDCYLGMFYGCTSLTSAPALPATTPADGCYYKMFLGCTSLTQAPELPATTLADYCYGSMFFGCTSLTQAPELPAMTLADDCYSEMFSGCTHLSSIDVNFTAWTPSNATDSWLTNAGTAVSGSKIFTCPSALPQTRGTSYIPDGWTIVTK